jgi:hypothetical protein
MDVAFVDARLEHLAEYIICGKLRLNNAACLSENEDILCSLLGRAVT